MVQDLGILLGLVYYRKSVGALFVLGIHQLFYAMSSQGTAAVFQITMHKNLNAYHRMLGAANHGGIHVKLSKEPEYIPTFIHCREKLIYLPG
jgi:hypothetical protein